MGGISLAGSSEDDLQTLLLQKENLQEDLMELNKEIQALQLEKFISEAKPEESPEVLWEIASQYGKMQQIDKAVSYYQQFAEDYPNHELAPKAYILIASLHIFEEYFLTGSNVHIDDRDMDFSDAISALQKVLEIYPSSPFADDAEFGIALTYLLKANRLAVLREAGMQNSREYRESLEKHKEGLVESLALYKALLSKYPELVSDEDVVSWSGTSYSTVLSNTNVQYNIALIYDIVMDWENAVKEYKTYLALEPEGSRVVKAKARVRIIEDDLLGK
jgi:tetratricopeptide (TPR) repeat protein